VGQPARQRNTGSLDSQNHLQNDSASLGMTELGGLCAARKRRSSTYGENQNSHPSASLRAGSEALHPSTRNTARTGDPGVAFRSCHFPQCGFPFDSFRLSLSVARGRLSRKETRQDGPTWRYRHKPKPSTQRTREGWGTRSSYQTPDPSTAWNDSDTNHSTSLGMTSG
jgi:hypothetical protein